MSGVFLVAAKRTPFGTFGGSLKNFSATDLGTHATQAALNSIDLDPTAVDSIFFGNVIQSSADAAYLARHVGLKSGMKLAAPSLTINRLCGSGFETVILGAQSIQLGESNIAVCGGAENMSDAPLSVAGNDARWGVKLGTGLSMRDALWDGLTDSYANTPMGVTAENLAKKYGITREVRHIVVGNGGGLGCFSSHRQKPIVSSGKRTLPDRSFVLQGFVLTFCFCRRLIGMRRSCSSQPTDVGSCQGARTV